MRSEDGLSNLGANRIKRHQAERLKCALLKAELKTSHFFLSWRQDETAHTKERMEEDICPPVLRSIPLWELEIWRSKTLT